MVVVEVRRVWSQHQKWNMTQQRINLEIVPVTWYDSAGISLTVYPNVSL